LHLSLSLFGVEPDYGAANASATRFLRHPDFDIGIILVFHSLRFALSDGNSADIIGP
jgi:hypothetical protein